MFFAPLEDQFGTTSLDKTLRFWSVDTGDMLVSVFLFEEVTMASFLPYHPDVCVVATSSAALRLIDVQNVGQVVQELNVESEVRALRFDDTGLFLLAGGTKGFLHVLEVSSRRRVARVSFTFKLNPHCATVTCITFVPPAHGKPACFLAATTDSFYPRLRLRRRRSRGW